MGQIRNWLRERLRDLSARKTIRSNLILSQCLVLLILTLLLGFSIYTFTCETLTSKNREAYGKILDASEVIMTDTLAGYVDIQRLILENETVQVVLSQQQRIAGNGIFMDPAAFSALDNELSSYANGVAGVASLYLFDNAGKLFYIDAQVRSMDLTSSVDYAAIQRESWYQAALTARGREVFWGYDVLGVSEDCFSAIKVLNSLNSQDKIGLLVVNISKSTLDTVFEPVVSQGTDLYGIYYVRDGVRHLVHQSGYEPTRWGESLEDILANHRGIYEIIEHVCQIEGWELLHVVEKSNIFLEARQIRLLIIVAGICATLVMAAITIRQVYRITRPLYQLRKDISLVGGGSYEFGSTYDSSEVGVIGQEFQRMVKDRIALKERVQEEEIRRQASELELLQSQINPHFLYNTLDTLYWMAVGEEQMGIAQLTQALSDVFRLSLNRGKELITIREELKFIRDYLYIQNIRFDGKFAAHIQVDQSVYDWKIIKLIIQPFVENAIYHGLEPKLERGNLSVTAAVTGDSLIITVEDDGVGMDADANMGKGYAMQNVMSRVRLHYGPEAQVAVDSPKGQGTRIQLRLPTERIRTDTLQGNALEAGGK